MYPQVLAEELERKCKCLETQEQASSSQHQAKADGQAETLTRRQGKSGNRIEANEGRVI